LEGKHFKYTTLAGDIKWLFSCPLRAWSNSGRGLSLVFVEPAKYCNLNIDDDLAALRRRRDGRWRPSGLAMREAGRKRMEEKD
jgi:hypothetical protein